MIMDVTVTLTDEQINALKNSQKLRQMHFLQKLGYSGSKARPGFNEQRKVDDFTIEAFVNGVVAATLHQIVRRSKNIEERKKKRQWKEREQVVQEETPVCATKI
jgi:hypothetical protein